MLDILMVDDDIGDTILTREALTECGVDHVMHVVHDGVEAIDFLKKEGEYQDVPKPDLILLDLNMPCMGGHEVLQWVKSQDKLKTIPVVILTTSTTHTDIVKSYENNANSYISKPMDLGDFKAAIQATSAFWFKTAKMPNKA